MSERCRVSIIIPSFNYGRFLGATLASVQAQSFQDWECLVVDDGSTDHTRAVVEDVSRIDPRIRYLFQENSGVSKARNTGLHHSRGAYFQFLDGDDLLEKDKLQLHVAYLDEHREADLVYGEARYFSDGREDQRLFSMWDSDVPWMPKVAGAGEDVLRALIDNNIMVVNAPLVRRSVIDRVGSFNESVPALEDWEYWLRCALGGLRFDYDPTPETFALVRAHGCSMSRNAQRTLSAAIIIRERLSLSLADAELRDLNEARLRELNLWRDGTASALEEITRLIPTAEAFILVDEDQVAPYLPKGYVSFPFLEKDGEYWGRPLDDDVAIGEFERLWRRGAKFIVFAYSAFWWMEHYAGFAQYLRSRFPAVVTTEHLLVFELSRPSDEAS